MKFKFSLQVVLDVRKAKVESLEIELGLLNQERLVLQGQIEALEQKRLDLFKQIKEHKGQDEIDLYAISSLQGNVTFTEDEIERKQVEKKELEDRIEAKRKELVLAKQDEEVIEILKEKEYQRLMDQIESAERSMVDDIYVSRAFRMSREDLT